MAKVQELVQQKDMHTVEALVRETVRQPEMYISQMEVTIQQSAMRVAEVEAAAAQQLAMRIAEVEVVAQQSVVHVAEVEVAAQQPVMHMAQVQVLEKLHSVRHQLGSHQQQLQLDLLGLAPSASHI
jgi:hypothetical protein